jgi:hypothetical protein
MLEGATDRGTEVGLGSMSRVQLTQVVTELSAHPGLGPLASSLLGLAQKAWKDRDVVFPRPGSRILLAADRPASEILRVGEVDLTEIYQNGANTSEELDTLTALILLGTSAAWPHTHRERQELAQCLVWLETYSGLRCLTACGAVLDGARHRDLAAAIVELLEADTCRSPSFLSPAELQIGRAWVASCRIPECAGLAQRASRLSTAFASSISDPTAQDEAVRGELGPRPRHPVTVVLLAFTGILFIARVGQALGRVLLLRRAPTTVRLNEHGLELLCRQEILGRVVRERRLIVPVEHIRTVEREMRFPRLGLYAGLMALAFGTLIGTRLFVDGLRTTGLSLSLIAVGLAFVLVGVALDLVLSGLGDSMRGRCRLVVTTHRGRGWAIGNLDPSGVDRLLTDLSTRLAVPHE